MNTKRIESRANVDYRKVVEKIIRDKSLSAGDIIVWLLKELLILQKYILELLIDRISIEMEMAIKANNEKVSL